MLYRFERDFCVTYKCIVEADSLEEAKKKATDMDWESSDDPWAARYWGYQAWVDEGEECPTLEEYENGETDIEWDELEKDNDFYNHWHK